jgi:hypothetical protein
MLAPRRTVSATEVRLGPIASEAASSGLDTVLIPLDAGVSIRDSLDGGFASRTRTTIEEGVVVLTADAGVRILGSKPNEWSEETLVE